MSRAMGIQEKVLNEMHMRIGLQTTTSEMEALLGNQYERRQVGNALYQLAKKGNIQYIHQNLYLYTGSNGKAPVEEKDDHVYEQVGRLPDGRQIVRSEQGLLFVLIPLEKLLGDL